MHISVPVQRVFGDHIRQLREHAGLTVEQLSEKSGFSSHRLCAIEQGEINLDLGTMLILAMSVDTTLQDFLSGVAPKLRHQKFSAVRIIPFSGYRTQNNCQDLAAPTIRKNYHGMDFKPSLVISWKSHAATLRSNFGLSASTKPRPANRFSSEEF